jgi:hypothetical protein
MLALEAKQEGKINLMIPKEDKPLTGSTVIVAYGRPFKVSTC